MNATVRREWLETGIRLHDQGQADEAAGYYQRILAEDTRCADAHYLLGVCAFQRGELREAEQKVAQALRLNPKSPFYYHYYGLILAGLERRDEAIRTLRKGLRLRDDLAPMHEELGKLLHEAGDYAQAAKAFRRSLEIQPGQASVHNRLGLALFSVQKYPEAEAEYREAIRLDAQLPEAHNNLGNALYFQSRAANSIPHYREALRLAPDFAEAWNNLGNILSEIGNIEDAVPALLRASALQPDKAMPHINLGNAYYYRGQHEQAERAYRRALAIQPEIRHVHSNLLFTLNYRPEVTPEAIYAEHRRWAENLQRDYRPRFTFAPRPASRRLRVAYLSADFRWHSVAYFFLPLLRAHDRGRFEVHCLNDARKPDGRTAEIKALAEHWHDVAPLKDEALADKIHALGIDILVELGGHTDSNRLGVLAQKPAPIQVSWLGYPNTTGLDAIDWRFSDAIVEPPGAADRLSAEKIHRLPEGFHCYEPSPECPPIPPQGTLDDQRPIVFASFNTLPKQTPEVIATWAEILRLVPNSKLLLKGLRLADNTVQRRYGELIARHGVDPLRLQMAYWKASPREHFETYLQVDIGLDPFPYNGTTTTCEALWMGTPVLTVAGERHAGRVGASLLRRVGHPELIAENREDYIARAVALAQDRPRLRAYRQNLRLDFAASPLANGPAFAAAVEAAYTEFAAVAK